MSQLYMPTAPPLECGHDPAQDCGCWVDDTGAWRRHAFRFLPGDRVHWGGVLHHRARGVTGTVMEPSRGGRFWVRWDEGSSAMWAPTTMPDSLQVTHLEP